MFLHPEHVLREQRRRHSELISAIAMERGAAAARPSHDRFRTIARRIRKFASARRWRQNIVAPFTRHHIPVPEPTAPRRMPSTTLHDTPKAAATPHTVAGSVAE